MMLMVMLVTTWALGVTAAMCGAECCMLLQSRIFCFMTPELQIVLQNAECYPGVSSAAGQTAYSGQCVIITKKLLRKTDIINQ